MVGINVEVSFQRRPLGGGGGGGYANDYFVVDERGYQ